MEYRVLGLSGLRVSTIGLGCMGMSHAYGAPADRKEMTELFALAVDMGYTFFDTAEVYGTNTNPHDNEELLGDALKPFRDKIVIATKFGLTFDKSSECGPYPLIPNSKPKSIRLAVEGSLARLKTDHLDLYYQHRIDPQVEPEEVADTMAYLIKEGKVLHWGISEAGEDYIRRAHKVCPITAIQNRYSMMARWHEKLFPVVEELGIAYVAFSPMANGFLTGRYHRDSVFENGTDYRSDMPQYTEEGFTKGQELLELLHNLAEKKGATPAQISLAWMLCKKPFIIPIPGSRKTERLKENFDAMYVSLTEKEIADIDKKLDAMKIPVFGGH